MEKEIEETFVNTYIVKNRRERLLYELFSKNKRKNALSRFCHNSTENLIASKIAYAGKETLQLQNSISRIKDEYCYVLSFEKTLDGTWCKKSDIISRIIGLGMPSIAVFSHMAIIETEQIQGSAVKFILGRC